MAGSKLYLGADAVYEARLRGSSNCDLATLHRLSQRAAAGITIGSSVGVHPGVFYRLVKEQIAARRGRA